MLISTAGLIALAVGNGGSRILSAAYLVILWIVLGGIAWFLGRRWTRAWLLATWIGAISTWIIAMVAVKGFGVVVVGSAALLLTFMIIGNVGEWRWRARDDHERRSLRSGQTCRFSAWWDIGIGLLVVAAVVALVAGVGLGSVGIRPGLPFAIAVSCLFAAVTLGVQLDYGVHEQTSVAAESPGEAA
jgi:hypothetical protein